MIEAARMRVAFVTLGCKVNQTESEAIAEALGVAGAGSSPSQANVVVVNTCTVTGEADHKARKAVRHALALPNSPVVVVTGCLAAVDAQALQALGDRVIVEADKTRVAERVRASAGPRGLDPGRARFRTRAQLKVEDGCDQFCSYCIVPYARGVPRAVPLSEVVARAESLARDGVAEVVLTGINIGRYEHEDKHLPDVLEAVAASGIPRVRISSIESGDVTPQLLETAARLPAFCRHLHIPLQSGSDEVLRRMGRPYDTRSFADTIAGAREALVGLAVTTDVIVGFPGESEAEFAETLAFVRAQAFSRLHVFRYSARPGTPAASMPGQVPPAVKAARSAELRALGEASAEAYARSLSGSVAEVLVERVSATSPAVAEGMTREYLRAAVQVPSSAPRPQSGQLLSVVLEASDPDGVVRGRLSV